MCLHYLEIHQRPASRYSPNTSAACTIPWFPPIAIARTICEVTVISPLWARSRPIIALRRASSPFLSLSNLSLLNIFFLQRKRVGLFPPCDYLRSHLICCYRGVISHYTSSASTCPTVIPRSNLVLNQERFSSPPPSATMILLCQSRWDGRFGT